MTAETTDIRFECHECGQRLVVESTAAGEASSCPICAASVTVPKTELIAESSGTAKPAGTNGRHGLTTATSEPRPPAYADPEQAGLRDDLVGASLRNAELERELAEAREASSRLEHQLSAATGECGRLRASATHTQAELKTFQGERQQLKTELSNLRQRLATTEAQVLTRDRELADARASAVEWEEMALATDEQLKEERTQRYQLAGELGRSRQTLGAEAERIAALEAQLGTAAAEIERLTTDGTELRSELIEAHAHLGEMAALRHDLTRRGEELEAVRGELQAADDVHRALSATRDELQLQCDGLKRDLVATDSGRELVELRARLATTETDREQTATRLAQTETDFKAVQEAEAKLRIELAAARVQHEETSAQLEAAAESRVSKDNDVLRGIINRQNSELAQRTIEIHRLKRARFAVKILYALFGIGLMAVLAFALKVLVPLLKF